jgi:hypothetical protein
MKSNQQNRRFRILKVKYPKTEGYLASGMSCEVQIQFTPGRVCLVRVSNVCFFKDSLSPVKDFFSIRTEDEKLDVQIIAQKTPPVLSLPRTLVVGNCLVDEIESYTFDCVNTGGPGNRIFNEFSVEYLLKGKCVVKLDEEAKRVFQISPEQFELKSGESTSIEVTFTPKERTRYTATFSIVMNDMEEVEYTLTGNGTRPFFNITTNRSSAHFMTPHNKLSAALMFKKTQPDTVHQQSIAIANLSR